VTALVRLIYPPWPGCCHGLRCRPDPRRRRTLRSWFCATRHTGSSPRATAALAPAHGHQEVDPVQGPGAEPARGIPRGRRCVRRAIRC